MTLEQEMIRDGWNYSIGVNTTDDDVVLDTIIMEIYESPWGHSFIIEPLNYEEPGFVNNKTVYLHGAGYTITYTRGNVPVTIGPYSYIEVQHKMFEIFKKFEKKINREEYKK